MDSSRIGRRPTILLHLLIGAVSVGVFVLVSIPGTLYDTIFWTGLGITGLFAVLLFAAGIAATWPANTVRLVPGRKLRFNIPVWGRPAGLATHSAVT